MRLGVLALICFLCMAPVYPAQADSATSTSSPTATQYGSVNIVDRVTVWVLTQQRTFHRALTERLRNLTEGGGGWPLIWPLIASSFLYGVFHAAGPGHGKAVVSGYLLSHRQSLRRGIGLAAAAAFLQGAVAIAIVYGLVKLAGWLPRDAQTAVLWSERASFLLVAALGGYLLIHAAKRMLRRQMAGRAAGATPADHRHAHNDTDDCGHAHMPTPADLEAVTDWKSAAALVLSIGARPCSGAVIVLVFANVMSLHWAGIGAVAAMSAGTALTVSMLACFAVTARRLAGRVSWMDGPRAAVASDIVAALGGGVIFLLGVSLLLAALTAPVHPIIGQ